jgi:hypothetical protein
MRKLPNTCRPPSRYADPGGDISGVVQRVTFANDESGFCVLRTKHPDTWSFFP